MSGPALPWRVAVPPQLRDSQGAGRPGVCDRRRRRAELSLGGRRGAKVGVTALRLRDGAWRQDLWTDWAGCTAWWGAASRAGTRWSTPPRLKIAACRAGARWDLLVSSRGSLGLAWIQSEQLRHVKAGSGSHSLLGPDRGRVVGVWRGRRVPGPDRVTVSASERRGGERRIGRASDAEDAGAS